MLIRAYPKSVIAAFFVGALPWFLVNWLLLGHLVVTDFDYLDYDSDFDSESRFLTYQFVMLVLVFLQTPIAGALTTVSLGRSCLSRSQRCELLGMTLALMFGVGPGY